MRMVTTLHKEIGGIMSDCARRDADTARSRLKPLLQGISQGLCLLGLAAAPLAHADDADDRAAALVAKMTREEKVAQAMNAAPAIPRLGVPAYEWWNEGLHGIARNGYATVFPQAIGLAATWNTALLEQVGTVTSTEARAKFNLAGGPGKDHPRYAGLTIWSPNINIFRDPRWGRGMETYGEDPYLTGQLAVGFIHGLQGDDLTHPRTIATPKHLAVHSGPEPGRHGFDVDVSPHDLEATYTPAFRAAIVDGRAGSVMCAYNALHGTPACAADWLLNGRLRGDWGFTGFVVSDCDAVDDMTQFHYFRADNAGSSAAALKAGHDLNCGYAYRDLGKAIARGDADEALLDQSLVRLFAARYRLGELQPQRKDPYAQLGAKDVDSAAHRALALQAAQQSIVLLQNRNATLPLRPGLRLAVIGPNADALAALEANYQGTSAAPVTPLLGLRERFGAANVRYAQGAPLAAGVSGMIPETALHSDGTPGLRGEYFDNVDLAGTPRTQRQDRVVSFNWDHVAPAKGVDKDRYAVRWSGELLPPGPGDYTLAVRVARCFDCAGHDPVRLYIDDQLVVAGNAEDKHVPAGMHNADGRNVETVLHFDDTRPRRIRLELEHRGQDQGLRLEWLAPAAPQLAEAERAVAQADAVVAFVGLSPDVEGEELRIDVPGFDGGDRNDLALPAAQQALLERAKASGKPLVVVLMSGSAVALNWAKQHADAIVAAWYPGQSGGTAIAQVLAGDVNPGGRLPVTFYRSTKDLPAYVSYDMKGRTYRYFKGEPLFAFGSGLSYTRFTYAAPQLSATTLQAGANLQVRTQVSNSGTRAGDEVVQVYLQPPQGAQSPLRTLVGFQRVTLQPGEAREVGFELTPRQLSDVDRAGQRAVQPGDYRVFVGGGQPGTGAPGDEAAFSIQGTVPIAR
ncbi:glycoside hydrolase family 3 C-terminal domain-containing protein [Xanthomonas translucens]|uniref:glycoside hydrolase family 3 C-terminal domain-containing protein n=2 Tax=Xanthomonas campestris pv. translucens TaxID=343 RepID=UPI000AB0B1BE|nr:glycoside hydrolase family 3 C-terminal domain-containing protein [Xanthomonas translucens]MBC3974078.1 glycoside hydrolase family 3 C-terminal domain-containing protein [Xanthomonas translucens pv. undulosa]MCT8284039.1 glycoside hydrolase family 3 C-terminal domain-containing protein [Xanthomonas translucens pv. undulosa]MCT8318841.1 glycoside hydrolase family 3 C-terminal domain-containing protein [Xanthomonas translucens pv. undulosa]QSQ57200.1 glycoside hydrolase family 3 C-terminal dom